MTSKTWKKSLLKAPDLAILRAAHADILNGLYVFYAVSRAVDVNHTDQMVLHKDRNVVIATYVRRIREWAESTGKYPDTLGKNWVRRGKGFAKRRAKLIADFIAACEKAGVAEFKAKVKAVEAEKKARAALKKQKAKDPGVTKAECDAADTFIDLTDKPAILINAQNEEATDTPAPIAAQAALMAARIE